MKKVIACFALFLFFSGGVFGQGCSRFYPMKEGATLQYTNYDKKGKSEGVIYYSISGVSEGAGITRATMNMSLKDKKGKEAYTSTYQIECTKNSVIIDYNSLVPDSMLEQMGNMEMEVTGTDIEVPNDLSIDQTLSDASVTIKMNMGAMNMTTEIFILNRKVEKKEVVSTPAGSFDCYVIYSDTQSSSMGIKRTFPSRIWLAEGIGMVKQETYQKNGTLMGLMELTAYSQ